MTTLDSIVNVTVNLAASGLEAPSFNTPLVLSTSATFPELVKSYSTATFPTDMVADGFAVTDPTYLKVAAIAAQNNRPPTVKVGRRTNLPTQALVLTVPDAVVGKAYTVTINGTAFTVTGATPALDTVIEIAAQLVADITAASITNLTATDNLDGTIDLGASVAGVIFNVEVSNVNLTDSTADGGIATDLAAIVAVDNDWYHLLTTVPAATEIAAAATFVQANRKRFTVASGDAANKTGTGSIMETIDAAGQTRTAVVYSDSPFNGTADGGIIGQMANFDPPGSAEYRYNQVIGSVAANLTQTQKDAIANDNGSYFNQVGTVTYFEGGNGGGGTPLDITEAIDWFTISFQQRIFLLFLNNQKIPYTATGINQIAGEAEAQVAAGIAAGIIDPILDEDAGTPPVVVRPTRASQSPVDIANRLLRGLQINFRLSGSIRTINVTVNAQL